VSTYTFDVNGNHHLGGRQAKLMAFPEEVREAINAALPTS
jgi:hypothetical protein